MSGMRNYENGVMKSLSGFRMPFNPPYKKLNVFSVFVRNSIRRSLWENFQKEARDSLNNATSHVHQP